MLRREEPAFVFCGDLGRFAPLGHRLVVGQGAALCVPSPFDWSQPAPQTHLLPLGNVPLGELRASLC